MVESETDYGATAGEMTIDLGNYSNRQMDRPPIDLVGAEAGQITIRATIELGSAAVYSSVVDNTSGDPVFILAVPGRQ